MHRGDRIGPSSWDNFCKYLQSTNFIYIQEAKISPYSRYTSQLTSPNPRRKTAYRYAIYVFLLLIPVYGQEQEANSFDKSSNETWGAMPFATCCHGSFHISFGRHLLVSQGPRDLRDRTRSSNGLLTMLQTSEIHQPARAVFILRFNPFSAVLYHRIIQ